MASSLSSPSGKISRELIEAIRRTCVAGKFNREYMTLLFNEKRSALISLMTEIPEIVCLYPYMQELIVSSRDINMYLFLLDCPMLSRDIYMKMIEFFGSLDNYSPTTLLHVFLNPSLDKDTVSLIVYSLLGDRESRSRLPPIHEDIWGDLELMSSIYSVYCSRTVYVNQARPVLFNHLSTEDMIDILLSSSIDSASLDGVNRFLEIMLIMILASYYYHGDENSLLDKEGKIDKILSKFPNSSGRVIDTILTKR